MPKAYLPLSAAAKLENFDKWAEHYGIKMTFAYEKGTEPTDISMSMTLHGVEAPVEAEYTQEGFLTNSTSYRELSPMRDTRYCKERLVKIAKQQFMQWAINEGFDHLLFKGEKIEMPWTKKVYKERLKLTEERKELPTASLLLDEQMVADVELG